MILVGKVEEKTLGTCVVANNISCTLQSTAKVVATGSETRNRGEYGNTCFTLGVLDVITRFR